ncbi:MAG: hypothetical protein M0C28_37080 [Candidatus Moduliflexus flocculans]|nr:hypothetical protein [Candidatus Moduliflexus flocculans]
MASLKVRFNRVFGYYIEVTTSQPGQRARPTTSRKQTLAGAERYITPALKEYEEKVLGAEERVRRHRVRPVPGRAPRRWPRHGARIQATADGPGRPRRAGRPGRCWPHDRDYCMPRMDDSDRSGHRGGPPPGDRGDEPRRALRAQRRRSWTTARATRSWSSPAPTWPASRPSCARWR